MYWIINGFTSSHAQLSQDIMSHLSLHCNCHAEKWNNAENLEIVMVGQSGPLSVMALTLIRMRILTMHSENN